MLTGLNEAFQAALAYFCLYNTYHCIAMESARGPSFFSSCIIICGSEVVFNKGICIA